jgi:hypothetical protein
MSGRTFQTERGEELKVKLYRAGDATITVTQPGVGHVTAFLSAEAMVGLRDWLASEVGKPEPAFVAPTQEFNPWPSGVVRDDPE